MTLCILCHERYCGFHKVNGVPVCDRCFREHCAKLQAAQKEIEEA